MRNLVFSLALLTLLGSASFAETKPAAGAKPPAETKAPSAEDLKKQEMMKVWQEFATPGPQHKILASMVGKWKYTSKFWETSDAAPQESKGKSHMKLILGDRFLEHKIEGKVMGMKFEGLGITGYDNIKGKFETLWLDNMGTGIAHGIGNFDDKTQTLTDKGEMSCPMTKSKKREFRGEWKIIDKKNMIYSMFGPGKDGKDMKQMEMVFTRK